MAETQIYDVDIEDVGNVLKDVLEEIFEEISDIMFEADFSPAFEKIHDDLLLDHAEFYGREESPAGDPWQALAESTIARKGHDQILYETGLMEGSLTTEGQGHVKDITPEFLVFGTDVEYSRFHQSGGKNLPQRQHVGMNERTVERTTDDIADFCVDLLME